MKFLAILKDSLREAVDSKIIYVMMGISVLLTLFVLTLSFKPLAADQMMMRLLNGGDVFRLAALNGGDMHVDHPVPQAVPENIGQFSVLKVDVLKGQPDQPESTYAVTVGLLLEKAAEADKVRKQPEQQLRRLRSRLAQAEQMNYFKVIDVRYAGANNPLVSKVSNPQTVVFFEFTTEPVEGSQQVWTSQFSLFLGAVPVGSPEPLGLVLFYSAHTVLWIGSLVTLLVSVILTGFFIPNMLRKGTVDLLLVKPMHRWALLLNKYVGGLTFIFLNTTVAIVGIWLALGLRSGIWANSFLLMIFVYTFFFAILYAVSALFAVLTRNAVVAILVTCGVWFLLFIVNVLFFFGERERIRDEQRHVPETQRTSENGFWRVVRGVHYVLPRTGDLDQLGNEALLRDFIPPRLVELAQKGAQTPFTWGESLTVSGVFIGLMLGLACLRFTTKDY
jgi:ABC-type transport system involved in multi-copper enzyme maturation permease subunit